MDIKETGEKLKKGVKEVPSRETAWMVAGALAGLMFCVMAMSAWFADKPSLTTYVYPGAPIPPQYMTPAEPTVEPAVEGNENGNGGF